MTMYLYTIPNHGTGELWSNISFQFNVIETEKCNCQGNIAKTLKSLTNDRKGITDSIIELDRFMSDFNKEEEEVGYYYLDNRDLENEDI